ncbi:hypothetical protein [Tropicimonas sp. IMCC6043]|uniref:GumC family protein n=1 Tax=Tropicimonas sp. IMCC6043 TaxID=2510645 RepID=UPI00101C5958|nr:hypothetical protein [Tropicimonas sp. IMCC6043]RYH10996.1 hypothetical protein EU800_07050 [Tropicimonas sp. IMCC6043]
MSELKYYFARFLRRLHWFLVVSVAISAVAVTVAMTLPPAYESEVRLIVESEQIPNELARSTVSTSATEQLQIIEQRLMTRENLLDIAEQVYFVRGQQDMNADEIVQAMRAQTRIRQSSGRNMATVMSIQFEAPVARSTAAVLNAYLSLILEQAAEFRTARAVTTQEFFEQQVDRLNGDLQAKSAEILEFKNANSDALPETLQFRMSELSRLQSDMSRAAAKAEDLRAQRQRMKRLVEIQTQMRAEGNLPTAELTERQKRLASLRDQLVEARAIYSDESRQVRHLQSLIGQLEAQESPEGTESDTSTEAADAPPTDFEEIVAGDPLLALQVSELDSQIAAATAEKEDLESQIAELRDTIDRTPPNAIALEALERDYDNLQIEYNNAVANLSAANTGERIEFMSRGQRILVIEPPSVPNEPTKPNRKKLAVAGVGAGVLAGLALVYLLEVLNRTPRRPEDIVARFEVMPIATIPYVRTRRQMVVDRAIKLLVILSILVGIPAAIWAIHEYYMPLDLIADKVMTRLGVRW